MRISERKEQLADALKKMGYSSNQVSIATKNGNIKATIRNASVSYSKVAALVGNYDNYQRCERTGDILEGGNTFAYTQIAENVAQEWGTKYAHYFEAIYEDLKQNPLEPQRGRVVMEKDGLNVTVWWENSNMWNYKISISSTEGSGWGETRHFPNHEKQKERNPQWYAKNGEWAIKNSALSAGLAVFLEWEKRNPLLTPAEAAEAQKEKEGKNPIETKGGITAKLHKGGNAYVITGDTRPIKDKLSKLPKCSWNRPLSCWVISKKEAEANKEKLQELGVVFE